MQSTDSFQRRSRNDTMPYTEVYPGDQRGEYLEDVNEIPNNVLGKGSYGVVIEAEWEGVKVATKRIHDLLLEHTPAKDKAEEEAKLLQRLRHPNLIQCFGHYYDGRNRLCIVLELMHISLHGLLRRKGGPLSTKEAYDIGIDVSSALRYLHSRNVSHRDVTPKNILLTENGKAKLSDLGGAKHVFHVHSPIYATRQPGTPIYMPQEALFGTKYVPSSVDVYSLGVVLLEMMSGENPEPDVKDKYKPCENPTANGQITYIRVPEEERRKKCFKKIAQGDPIRTVILKCLNDEPSARPSAVEIQQWLQDPDSVKRASTYDDVVGPSNPSGRRYVNVDPGPPLPPKPKQTSQPIISNMGTSSSQDEARYQPLINIQEGRHCHQSQSKPNKDSDTYVPTYIDGNPEIKDNYGRPRLHGIRRDLKTYYGTPNTSKDGKKTRSRVQSVTQNPPIEPLYPPSTDGIPPSMYQIPHSKPSHPEPVAELPQPSHTNIPMDDMYVETDAPAPPRIRKASPPLPPRTYTKYVRSKGNSTGEVSTGSEEDDVMDEHDYESIDSTSNRKTLTVLRVTKKKQGFLRKGTGFNTSENELLVTDNKDAGPKLYVTNTKGVTGEIHEDCVITVDPAVVPYVQGNSHGILYQILTCNKRQSVSNGNKLSKISISHSSSLYGNIETLFKMPSNNIVATEDPGNEYPYFQFDFKKHRLVELSGYQLQCSGHGTYGQPQEWEIHVSLEGKKWQRVAHDVWEKESQTKYCTIGSGFLGRYVKIIQIGLNLKGNKKFCLSGVEFYGKLYSSVQDEI